MRGFGMTFDLRSGGIRNWYVDKEGAKRWADNDEMVMGLAGVQDDEPIPYTLTEAGKAYLEGK